MTPGEKTRSQEQIARSALIVAAGATFMAYLDVTVVNVAFPDLQRDFPRTAVADLTWIVSSYAVLLAALLTPAGRLADIVGRRRFFALGVAGFAAASAVCALAPSVALLIAARAVQGAAAAAMIPAALGLVLGFSPPERRIAAVGIWGAAGSLAAAAGPTIGGVLVEGFGWRSVFAINVPIAVALAALARARLPELRQEAQRAPDLAGTVLLTAGVAGLATALTKASDWGWSGGWTVGLLGGGIALAMLALLRSRRHPAPAVETRLWGDPIFASASLTSVALGGAIFAWMLICPVFLVAVWKYSVLQAGLAVSPGAVTSAVASVAMSRLATPERRRAAAIACALIMAGVGIWMSAALPAEPNFLLFWLPAGLICGVGMGGVMVAVSTAAATSLPPERFAAGTGLVMTARQLGGGLGVAATASILTAGKLGIDSFRSVFLLCALAAIAAAVAAIGLAARPKRARETAPAAVDHLRIGDAA